jgi:hypothetical protein
MSKDRTGQWDRREFLTAMGAGITFGDGLRPARWHLPRRAPVSIYIMGTFLAMKAADHPESIDILLPDTHRGLTYRHPDCRTPSCDFAKRHDPRMAFYHTYDKDEYIDSLSLEGGGITLFGKTNDNTGVLTELVKLRDVLPNYVAPREDTYHASKVYSSRIRIVGGTFTTVIDNRYSWHIEKLDNPGTYVDIKGVHALKWNSGVEGVMVASKGTEDTIPQILSSSTTPAVAIGHLHEDPEDWFKKRPQLEPQDHAHDFKWIYSALANSNDADEDDPWPDILKGRMLPIPMLKSIRARQPGDPYEAWTVGSPNCFGGCFGC